MNKHMGMPSSTSRRGLMGCALLMAAGLCASGQSDVNSRVSRDTNSAAAFASLAQTDSLERAWTEAIASAHRLKATHKSTEAARETFSATKATRYPTVTAQGGHFWLDEAPAAVVSLPGSPGLPVVLDDQFWAGRVTAALPLFTSGRIRHGVDAAKAGWKAAQAEERRETLDLKLGVADAYVKVLRTTRAVRVKLVRLKQSYPQVDAYGAWIKVFAENPDAAGARGEGEKALAAIQSRDWQTSEPELEDVFIAVLSKKNLVAANSDAPAAPTLPAHNGTDTEPGLHKPPQDEIITIEAKGLVDTIG